MMSTFLLVHGVYHGPECWDEVSGELRRLGHRTHAVALRGHAPADRGHHDMRTVEFEDYLDDVRAALRACGPDTILVGHSLGGMLVSALSEQDRHRGIVLVSTPTRRSLRRGTWILLRHFPLATLRFLATLRPESIYHDPRVVSRLFWSTSAENLARPEWLDRVFTFTESRKLFRQVLTRPTPPADRGVPRLVVGGGRDLALPVREMERLAQDLGAPLRILDDAPHDVMSTHPAELAGILDGFARRSGDEGGWPAP